MKYNYEAYDIDGEVVGGGYVFAASEDQADEQIEEEIENNYDEYVSSGYAYHRITGTED